MGRVIKSLESSFPMSSQDSTRMTEKMTFFFLKVTVGGLVEESKANSEEFFSSSSAAQIKNLKERLVCLSSLPFKKGSFAKEFCEMSCLFISG